MKKGAPWGHAFSNHLRCKPLRFEDIRVVAVGAVEVQPMGRADLVFDLICHGGVFFQEGLGVFTPLPDPFVAIAEPRARLVDHAGLDPEVEQLAERRQQLGEDGMAKAQQDWADLYEELGELMRAGTAPEDPALDALAATYNRLIEAFTGGDSGIRDSLQSLYDEEGPEAASHGMVNPELFAYANAVMAARSSSKGDDS